ncbi:hypothetical protein ACFE04_024743 [Oxalis oulophora]
MLLSLPTIVKKNIQQNLKHKNNNTISHFCSTSSDQSQSLISSVVSLLTHHRSKSRWGHLQSLLHQHHQQLTPHQFSQIALHFKNKPHLLLSLFHFTQKHKTSCQHDLFSYSTLIHILSRNRLVPQARNLIRVAIVSPELHQTHHFSGFSDTKGETLLTKKPLRVFQSLVKTYKLCGSAPFVFDLLIKECLEAKKIDGSIQITRLLRSRGISPRVTTLNDLIWEVSKSIGACQGFRIYKEVFGLVSQNEENVKWVVKVRPSSHTFTNMMVSFYREGLLEKVEEIWYEMLASGCEVNSYGYSVLMTVFCDQGKIAEAEKLWEKITAPDLVAYNTMIGGFCKFGKVNRAEEFVREMELSGIESSCATYEHLVEGYGNIGDIDSAMLVYKDVKRKGFRPEASTMNMLIGVLCDKARVSEALEITRAAISGSSFNPTERSYELLIKGLCVVGKMEEAFKLQAEMMGKGFEPSLLIYGVFIDGYMKQGDEVMAAKLRKEMLEVQ